ncbi:serine hydrolase domain-containing protein [Actinomadura roseirufa]|uniref:serine hydrolase domain-containing protein n=1 Tax=Actinomadura roseirufa TaxID=2094049 RepID=UPI0013F15719|nr:serine hydrolase domain-containing protein [Actinomadura roseirufa]
MRDALVGLAGDVQATAERLAALPQVPGVQVAAIADGRIGLGAAGTADAQTGRAVTSSTRFRPGSITKLLTAGLVTACAADGRLSLDDPVGRFVPGPWDEALRVRHLISHSCGLDAADVFVDVGDEDDCVARYVQQHVAGAGTLFTPGTTFSYCNGGFVLAGRVLEVVLGRPFEEALRAEVLVPAATTDTCFAPGHASHDDGVTARGHLVKGQQVEPVPYRIAHPMCSRGLGPAGGTLVSTAHDLARVIARHLQGPDTASMRTLHAHAPGGVAGMRGAGLGWMMWDDPAVPSVRIGGAVPGQSGLIVATPSADTVLVVLTNSDQGANAVSFLLDGEAATATGPRQDSDPPADLGRYAGRYTSHVSTLDITAEAGGLRATSPGLPELTLTPQDRITFATPIGPVAFFGADDTGAPRYLRWRMRVWHRTT